MLFEALILTLQDDDHSATGTIYERAISMPMPPATGTIGKIPSIFDEKPGTDLYQGQKNRKYLCISESDMSTNLTPQLSIIIPNVLFASPKKIQKLNYFRKLKK